MESRTKIMLVEDDFIVRKGLIKTVDWDSINCEIVGEASDALEAIEKIKILSPDIIITDICMKEVDGIEMLKKLKEEKIDVKAIILSGYTDFEYAKSAMELGVRHYLLKPIENEKLIEAILSVRSELKKEKNIMTPTTKQQIALRKLLDAGNAAELLDNIGLVVPKGRFLVANIKIEKGYEEENNAALKHTTELLECVEYFSGIDTHYSISILIGERNVVMILFEKDGKMEERTILRNIRKQFGFKTGKRLTIGISGVSDDISRIHKLYEESCAALGSKNAFETDSLIYYDDIKMMEERFEPIFSEEAKAEILEAINVNAVEKVQRILRETFKKLKEHQGLDMENLKNTVIELAVMMVKQAAKNFEEMQMVFGRKIQPATEIVQLETVADVEAWFEIFTTSLQSHHEFMDVYRFSTLVREVCIYIMQNYSNKLNVDILAKQFFVSEGHLMRAFKRETNMTVIEFVTEYRIYIAKNLLKDKNNKIYDVSRRVGYEDAKYFSKVFKKITGEPPNQYGRSKN